MRFVSLQKSSSRINMNNEKSQRQNKMQQELIRHISAAVTMIAGPQALITVMRTDVSPNFKQATVYISVIPTPEEQKALSFLARHAHEIRTYLKEHLATRTIPFITFEIDSGERNRQRIDELSRNVKMDD